MHRDPNIDDKGHETRFQPGQSGNPKGRPKTKPMADALKELLYKDDGAAINAIAAIAVAEAIGGDYRFVKEIFDRIDGKVIEEIDLTADASLDDNSNLSSEELATITKMRGGPDADDTPT